MFEKSLTDLVKGIRASKRDTGLYISQCIAEIKTELSSTDLFVKATALQKLTFLQMMGYDMSWASFPCVEVMSSPRFAHKRIGYLAASQAFDQDTEVILLTTNLLKKELRSASSGGGTPALYESGLAINCLSNIVTADLARETLPEVMNLTQHPSPYLRKKSVLCLFKIFVKHPPALRLSFDRLRQLLSDRDPAVVSCAVNVITELSDKNPKNYLPLAPQFFSLLTSSSNNWMLIKVVKLLGSLVGEEPRLARKLLDPLATIVKNTQAKSLLYEAVHTLTLSLPHTQKSDGSFPPSLPSIVSLCSATLRTFVEDPDQNLKYLGLVGLGSLVSSFPSVITPHRDLVLGCLCDDDETIRTRALELLTSMATRKNLRELVDQLMKHVVMAEGRYQRELVATIIKICQSEKYALIVDFEWYLGVLERLARVKGVEEHGWLMAEQLTNVALRVLPVRECAVERMVEVLAGGEEEEDGACCCVVEVYGSAGWIVGEYASFLKKGQYERVLRAFFSDGNRRLKGEILQVYVQASGKVMASACRGEEDGGAGKVELERCVGVLERGLEFYKGCDYVEVVERACVMEELFKCLGILKEEEQEKEAASVVVTDDESEPDEEDAPSPEMDLLNLGVSSTVTSTPSLKPPASRSKTESTTTTNQSLVATCRRAQATLSYLLSPEPMKPISAKAQKKKRAAPPPGLDQTINVKEAFPSLFPVKKVKRSMEEVSFTQQRPMSVAAPPPDLSLPTESMEDTTSLSTSLNVFQKPAAVVPTAPTAADPFYLTNNGNEGGGMGPTPPLSSNRFGSIMLDDGDDDDDQDGRKKKKKKKKSKKDKNKNTMQELDLAILDTKTKKPPSAMPMTVYHSDDDDDDDDDNGVTILPSARRTNTNVIGSEFEGLSKIDLTKPEEHDDDDDIIPTPQQPTANNVTQEDKKSKKKKKKDKKKKKSSAETPPSTSATTGDLLDLGGFFAGPADASSAPPPPPPANAISSAYDDLLALDAPAPMLPVPTPAPKNDLLAFSTDKPQKGKKSKKDKSSQKKPSSPWDGRLSPSIISSTTLASELSSNPDSWYSKSISLALSNLPPSQITSHLASHLHAHIVEDGGSSALLAAEGTKGEKVRVLLKLKGGKVKLDIKSGDKGLGKDIVKDLKSLEV